MACQAGAGSRVGGGTGPGGPAGKLKVCPELCLQHLPLVLAQLERNRGRIGPAPGAAPGPVAQAMYGFSLKFDARRGDLLFGGGAARPPGGFGMARRGPDLAGPLGVRPRLHFNPRPTPSWTTPVEHLEPCRSSAPLPSAMRVRLNPLPMS